MYQKLLAIAAKAQFMDDLERMKHGKNSSYVESFWNVCIKYRPKRKYFKQKSFEARTMLGALAFNELRLAELRGDRRVSEEYQCFSKSKGEMTTKCKKSPIDEVWKKNIVKDAIEKKRIQGPNDPVDNDAETFDDDVEFLVNQLEELAFFSDSEEEDWENTD